MRAVLCHKESTMDNCNEIETQDDDRGIWLLMLEEYVSSMLAEDERMVADEYANDADVPDVLTQMYIDGMEMTRMIEVE